MCGFVAKRREASIALASLGTELPMRRSDENVCRRKWSHKHTEKLSPRSFQTSGGSYGERQCGANHRVQ